jgi:hypothetical protein
MKGGKAENLHDSLVAGLIVDVFLCCQAVSVVGNTRDRSLPELFAVRKDWLRYSSDST